jgi:hypothetical protein
MDVKKKESSVMVMGERLAWQTAFQDAIEILQKPYVDEVKLQLEKNPWMASSVGPIHGPVDIGRVILTTNDGDYQTHWYNLRLYPIYGVLKFIETETELKHLVPLAYQTLQKCFNYAASKIAHLTESSQTSNTYTLPGPPRITVTFSDDMFTPQYNIVQWFSGVMELVRRWGRQSPAYNSFLHMLTVAEECWITSFLANTHALTLGRNESTRLRNRFMKEAVLISKQPLNVWSPNLRTQTTYLASAEARQKEEASAAAAATLAAAVAPATAALTAISTDVKSVNQSTSIFGRPVVPIGFRPAAPSYQSFPAANSNSNDNSSNSSSNSSSGSSGTSRTGGDTCLPRWFIRYIHDGDFIIDKIVITIKGLRLEEEEEG